MILTTEYNNQNLLVDKLGGFFEKTEQNSLNTIFPTHALIRNITDSKLAQKGG